VSFFATDYHRLNGLKKEKEHELHELHELKKRQIDNRLIDIRLKKIRDNSCNSWLNLCFFCITYVPFVVKKPLRTLRKTLRPLRLRN
jgi:hypothetical protein